MVFVDLLFWLLSLVIICLRVNAVIYVHRVLRHLLFSSGFCWVSVSIRKGVRIAFAVLICTLVLRAPLMSKFRPFPGLTEFPVHDQNRETLVSICDLTIWSEFQGLASIRKSSVHFCWIGTFYLHSGVSFHTFSPRACRSVKQSNAISMFCPGFRQCLVK